jgi:hypothetical protein
VDGARQLDFMAGSLARSRQLVVVDEIGLGSFWDIVYEFVYLFVVGV